MISILLYAKPFTPGDGSFSNGPFKPSLVELQLPALYKPLHATVEPLNRSAMSLAALQRGSHQLIVTARVQDGPTHMHRFLVAQPCDTLPNAVLGRFDTGDPVAVQWNCWQGLYIPGDGHYSVFDVTHLTLEGYS